MINPRGVLIESIRHSVANEHHHLLSARSIWFGVLLVGACSAESSGPPSLVRDLLGPCAHYLEANSIVDYELEPPSIIDTLTATREIGPVAELSRVSDAAFVDRGRTIIVADEISLSVVVLDSTGATVATFGGQGKGPGEFQSIGGIAVFRDRVFVLDWQRGLVQIFGSAEYRYEGSIQLPIAPVRPWPLRTDSSGAIYFRATRPKESALGGLDPARQAIFVRFSSSGEAVDTIAFSPYANIAPNPGDPQRPIASVLFTPATFFDVWDDGVVAFGDGSEYQICILEAQDHGVRLTVEHKPEPLTDQDRSREYELWQRRVPRERLVFPSAKPSFNSLLAVADSVLLVGRTAKEREMSTYDVLSTRMAVERRLILVPGSYLTDASRTLLLGIHYDELGLPHVMLYRWKTSDASRDTGPGAGGN